YQPPYGYFVIGLDSGAAFSSLASGMQVLKQAAIYAFPISAVVLVCLMPLNRPGTAKADSPGGWRGLWYPLKECLIAFGLVLLGAFAWRLQWHDNDIGAVLRQNGTPLLIDCSQTGRGMIAAAGLLMRGKTCLLNHPCTVPRTLPIRLPGVSTAFANWWMTSTGSWIAGNPPAPFEPCMP